MNLSFLSGLVDAGKLGGWVRGLVAAGLVMLVAKYHPLGDVLTADAQTEIATAAATLAVGAWSHYVKS
jgi:fructose-specific phosphotransferase system IIC component